VLGPKLLVAQWSQQQERPISGLEQLMCDGARVKAARSGDGSHGHSGGRPAEAFMKGLSL
jgi:hypothetical protein